MENFDRENIDKLLEICQIRQYFHVKILHHTVVQNFNLILKPVMEILMKILNFSFMDCYWLLARGPPLFTILYNLLEISTENLQSLEVYNL